MCWSGTKGYSPRPRWTSSVTSEAWARNAIAKQTLDDQDKLVLQDEGTVKNDRGTVQFDEVQLDFCHITAPITGRVGLRLVDPGNVVQAAGNVPLTIITQLEPITVIFTLAEDSLAPVQARLAQGAQLAVDALDRTAQKKIATGTLITIDNQIDTTTGTAKARAVFDNAGDVLFPNQFVNTRLLVNTLQGRHAHPGIRAPTERHGVVRLRHPGRRRAHAHRQGGRFRSRTDAGRRDRSRRRRRQQQLRAVARRRRRHRLGAAAPPPAATGSAAP